MLCCRSTWRETVAFGLDMVPEESVCWQVTDCRTSLRGVAFPMGGFYPSWKIGMGPFGPAGHTASASMRTGYGIRLARRWAFPLLRLSRYSWIAKEIFGGPPIKRTSGLAAIRSAGIRSYVSHPAPRVLPRLGSGEDRG